MMDELDEIKKRTKPDNVFLVCDAMAGQDTVRTASEFNRRLDITGFIMTKLMVMPWRCGPLDSRSHRKADQVPGMGEDLEKLEEFRSEGLHLESLAWATSSV